MEKEIKKQVKKAVLFYKKAGFMDLTRFKKYLDGFGLSLSEIISLYLKTF